MDDRNNIVPLDEALRIAVQHHEAGRLAEAEAIYRKILHAVPDHADALHLLSAIAISAQRYDDGLELIRTAISINPGVAEYHVNHGLILKNKGQVPQAIVEFREAIRLRPQHSIAWYNLGNLLLQESSPAEAAEAYRRALDIDPLDAEAHNNLGTAIRELGRRDEAKIEFLKALELNPNLADAHWNIGVDYLLEGDFARGWPEYEWRWHRTDRPQKLPITQPMWHGEALNGRRMLLVTEQGLGDSIQFVRFVPMVIARGGRVILSAPPDLLRLFGSIPGIEELTSAKPNNTFDLHCPLMSLPLVLGIRLDSIPRDVPYLRCDPGLLEQWKQKLAMPDSVKKVGIAWAGNPQKKGDRRRSMALSDFAPLARIPGVRLYSLQKGPAAEQIRACDFDLVDHTSDLHDFADTAALVSHLDLVISVDTAVAHLAGALAKPVWTLLPSLADWRWMLNRDDSPWYPTMRLFRQRENGNWSEVIERVTKALKATAAIT